MRVKEHIMTESNRIIKDNFIYPRRRYYGQMTPENLVFNSNLQEFSQKVSYISCLETNGKLSPDEAYQQIKQVWKQLKKSKKELGITANLND
jgi:hypothetical protein